MAKNVNGVTTYYLVDDLNLRWCDSVDAFIRNQQDRVDYLLKELQIGGRLHVQPNPESA